MNNVLALADDPFPARPDADLPRLVQQHILDIAAGRSLVDA